MMFPRHSLTHSHHNNHRKEEKSEMNASASKVIRFIQGKRLETLESLDVYFGNALRLLRQRSLSVSKLELV